MLLKLFQAKQNAMINQIRIKKTIVLINNHNQKKTQQKIAKRFYPYIFSNPKIALSKKFKNNFFDNSLFTQRISFCIIDEIYLVEK